MKPEYHGYAAYLFMLCMASLCALYIKRVKKNVFTLITDFCPLGGNITGVGNSRSSAAEYSNFVKFKNKIKLKKKKERQSINKVN